MKFKPAVTPVLIILLSLLGLSSINFTHRNKSATAHFFDNVVNDDQIVIGSECVGFDCMDGENFGFDVLRLKEGNLRLHFDDSSMPPFPSNDWRIVINDNSNGGDDYFVIEDATADKQIFRLMAGAPTHSLYLDSTGNLGVGTDLPVERLTVNGELSVTGTVTPSDVRMKRNIQPFQLGLEAIMAMNPVSFSYTESSGLPAANKHVGLVAQELIQSSPHLVKKYRRGSNESTGTYYGIKDSEIKYLLVNSIKQQHHQIADLQKQVNNLTNQNMLLLERLTALEVKMQTGLDRQ